MGPNGLILGLVMTGVLAACGSSERGGSGVESRAGSSPGGSAGSGGLSLGTSGGGAGAGGAAGNAGGGTGGNGGSSPNAGGSLPFGSAGDAGGGGRPPSAPHPTGGTIYFCLGDACPHGGCSGGEVPSCDQLWGPLGPTTLLCEPEKSGTYCLWTDDGQWLIDCAESDGYVQKCTNACGTVAGVANCED